MRVGSCFVAQYRDDGAFLGSGGHILIWRTKLR